MEENIALRQALEQFSAKKADNEEMIPGLLGVTMNGANQVECSGRNGYVWVRLHGSQTNFVQAYNDSVIPIFGMPCYVARNPFNRSQYYLIPSHETHPNTPYPVARWGLNYYDQYGAKHFAWRGNAGQVLVASSANMTWANRNYPVWFTSFKTHPSWDADAQVMGTTTFAVNNFNSNIPAGATAIYAYIEAAWAAAADTNYLILKPSGATGQSLGIRSWVAGEKINGSGIVPLDASGQFDIVIGGADTLLTYIWVWGYWINT